MIFFSGSTFSHFLKVVISLTIFHHLLVASSALGNEVEEKYLVLRIAAASNLRFSMDEIANRFEQKHGIALEVSYGASGNLLAQIIAGAPFDLFFSADEAMPLRLIEVGFGLPDDYFIYGTGRIVLWVTKDSPIHLEDLEMKALLHHSTKKIAIANPRHAPYGLAAITTLKHLNLFDSLKDKLVMGENVSHAATFVRQGHAEIGILSYALALAVPLKKSGHYWLIPLDYHSPLNQGGLILGRSKHRSLAKSLVNFIKSGEGLSILKKYGFFENGVMR